MFRHKLSLFEEEVVIIQPGEYYVTRENEIIATVLGSCVSVALYDVKVGYGGLNHFMLPHVMNSNLAESKSAKYGMYAMEVLINALLSKGCRKERLVAKVFGGGSVLDKKATELAKIPQSNIDFSLEYLEAERIPIVSQDLGGTHARKIFYRVRDSRVFLKRYDGQQREVELEEVGYLRKIRREEEEEGTVTLFNP
jgi:chemotaxis protein CheD